MGTASGDTSEDVIDQFLTNRGHTVDPARWNRDRNKLQCPECSGLHDLSATACAVCGWAPSH